MVTPIRVAYMTSLREVALDESCGRWIDDPQNGRVYREGSLEFLVRMLGEDPAFAQTFELGAVVTDADEAERTRVAEAGWPWPDMRTPQGTRLSGLEVHEPSRPWRSISRSTRLAEHHAAKREYELRLLSILDDARIDLVVTDSYVPLITPTLLNPYQGRMVNIHPALLSPDDPAHLPGITPTFDGFTRAKYGWIRVDNKHAVEHPPGTPYQVEFEGKTYTVVDIPRSNRTGATLHVTIEEVDKGPAILERAYEFPTEGLEVFDSIRTHSYPVKNGVLRDGLMAYAQRQRTQERILAAREMRAAPHATYGG